MDKLLPWIALLVGGTALALALMPVQAPPTAAAAPTPTTAVEQGAIDALRAEIAALRSQLADRASRSDLERLSATLADGHEAAPVAVTEERIRDLIQESLRAQRPPPPAGQPGMAEPGMEGNPPGGNPQQAGRGGFQPGGTAIDLAKTSEALRDQFKIEADKAETLAAALAEMQTTMRGAFTPGGDREKAMATMREAREKLEGVVEATIPEDKRDDFLGFMAEQMGMRGRGNRQRGGNRDEQPAPPAPAPEGVKDF